MKESGNMPGTVNIAEEFVLATQKVAKHETIKQYMPAVCFSVLIIIACVSVPGFFSGNNLTTLLAQLAIPMVCAVGMSYILIMGCIDLSLEGVVGFSGVLLSFLVTNSKTSLNLGFLGILIVLAVAAGIGAITGLIHTKLRLPSFIITYAMGIILKGFAVMIYRGNPVAVSSPLIVNMNNKILGIPIITWIAFLVFAISFIVMKYTSFGRNIFAIGDNENVIRAAGINVDRVKMLGFVISAVCSSIGGIIGLSRLKYGDISIGTNRVFAAITACVVGGISLAGGKGGMIECLIGVLFITLLNNILVLIGIDMEYQDAIQGIIVIISVVMSTVRKRNLIVK